jgi:hypothetical protein
VQVVAHEIFGIFAAALTGAIIVSALSPNANTAGVISASLNGFSGLVGAINAPVRGAVGQPA